MKKYLIGSALAIFGCFPFGDDNSPNVLPAFSIDSNTVSYFKFDEVRDTLYDMVSVFRGSLLGAMNVPGFQGNGISCSANKYVVLDSVIPNQTMNGTIELYLKIGVNFNYSQSYAIVGDQGARANLFYRDSTLYFLKNHTGLYKFVSHAYTPNQGVWYKISATWGTKGMRLFVDDSLIASNSDVSNYQMDKISGPGYDIIYLGFKNQDGLLAIGVGTGTYYFDGILDEFRVSKIERY